MALHRAYQGVLPPRVGLPLVPALVALRALAGLPVGVDPPAGGLVVGAPPPVRVGRRRDVLPHRRTVLQSRTGGRGVVALVGVRVGRLSSSGSGVGGVIVWIPSERLEKSGQTQYMYIIICIACVYGREEEL